MSQPRNLTYCLELIARGSGNLVKQQEQFNVSKVTDDSRLCAGKSGYSEFILVHAESTNDFLKWFCAQHNVDTRYLLSIYSPV